MREKGQCKIPDEEMEGIESYIRQLKDVDEGSFSFRYAAQRDGAPTLPDIRYVNMMRITVLMEPFVACFEGLDEVVHEQY